MRGGPKISNTVQNEIRSRFIDYMINLTRDIAALIVYASLNRSC